MLKYHSLRDKVFNLKNIYSAFDKVKKNKGKAGLDRVKRGSWGSGAGGQGSGAGGQVFS